MFLPLFPLGFRNPREPAHKLYTGALWNATLNIGFFCFLHWRTDVKSLLRQKVKLLVLSSAAGEVTFFFGICPLLFEKSGVLDRHVCNSLHCPWHVEYWACVSCLKGKSPNVGVDGRKNRHRMTWKGVLGSKTWIWFRKILRSGTDTKQ